MNLRLETDDWKLSRSNRNQSVLHKCARGYRRATRGRRFLSIAKNFTRRFGVRASAIRNPHSSLRLWGKRGGFFRRPRGVQRRINVRPPTRRLVHHRLLQSMTHTRTNSHLAEWRPVCDRVVTNDCAVEFSGKFDADENNEKLFVELDNDG